MDNKLFQNEIYKKIATDTIEQTIRFLFDNNKEFSIGCETKYLSFNPNLPSDVEESFGSSVMFILSGYTYETANLDNKFLYFEAGFGEDNFGSTVSLPLLAIKQIFVDEYPIVINSANPNDTTKVESIEEVDTSISMAALLNNPENKKFLKR